MVASIKVSEKSFTQTMLRKRLKVGLRHYGLIQRTCGSERRRFETISSSEAQPTATRPRWTTTVAHAPALVQTCWSCSKRVQVAQLHEARRKDQIALSDTLTQRPAASL